MSNRRSPPRLQRDEAIACAALLLLFVALRIAAARSLAFDLLEPEELLNLRLVRQLQGGFGAGELGRYWYTGVGGNTGAGSFVLSLLYVPMGWFVDPDVGANRLMGALWGIGGAVLLAAVGRELLGRGGAAVGMGAAAAMPPTWLAWSLTAYGNYFEAAVLTLLAAWLLLRLERATTLRRKVAWAATLGWTLSFTLWFCVSAAPPVVLLLLLSPLAIGRGSAIAAAGLIGGLLLGAAPELAGFGPTTEVPSPVATDAFRGVLGDVLSAPGDWPRIVWGSLAAMPLLAYRDVPPEDWAAGWQLATDGPIVMLSWLLVLAMAVLAVGPRRVRARVGLPDLGWTARGLLAALTLCALAIPPGLSAIGTGPESLGLEQLYFYDPRRAAIVYPVMALAWATAAWLVWRWRPARAAVGAGLLFALLSQALITTAVEAPPREFHPIRYLLCPSEQPVDMSSVCIGALWEDQVKVLEALVEHPDFASIDSRRAALMGFGALERDEDHCELPPGSVSDDANAWFGLGASAITGCGIERGRAFCETAADSLAAACTAGMNWAQPYRVVLLD